MIAWSRAVLSFSDQTLAWTDDRFLRAVNGAIKCDTLKE